MFEDDLLRFRIKPVIETHPTSSKYITSTVLLPPHKEITNPEVGINKSRSHLEVHTQDAVKFLWLQSFLSPLVAAWSVFHRSRTVAEFSQFWNFAPSFGCYSSTLWLHNITDDKSSIFFTLHSTPLQRHSSPYGSNNSY